MNQLTFGFGLFIMFTVIGFSFKVGKIIETFDKLCVVLNVDFSKNLIINLIGKLFTVTYTVFFFGRHQAVWNTLTSRNQLAHTPHTNK